MSRAMVFGITFAIAGNVLISFALNLQKLAHARLEEARAGRGHGPDVMEQEGGANPDAESAGIEVPRKSHLPPELEREARVWSGNSSEASLTLGPRSETDPLMALPMTPNAGHIHAVPTYGALFPNADEIHVRRVESSPLRQPPKTAERPGTGVAAENTNRPTHDGSNNESEYLKSKLWYALPGFPPNCWGSEAAILQVAWVFTDECWRDGEFHFLRLCPRFSRCTFGNGNKLSVPICERDFTLLQFALIANCLFAPLLLHERLRTVGLHLLL